MGCKMQSTITEYNDRLCTIKLCFFFFLKSPVNVLLRECAGGFPVTGFGSFCQPATVLEG